MTQTMTQPISTTTPTKANMFDGLPTPAATALWEASLAVANLQSNALEQWCRAWEACQGPELTKPWVLTGLVADPKDNRITHSKSVTITPLELLMATAKLSDLAVILQRIGPLPPLVFPHLSALALASDQTYKDTAFLREKLSTESSALRTLLQTAETLEWQFNTKKHPLLLGPWEVLMRIKDSDVLYKDNDQHLEPLLTIVQALPRNDGSPDIARVQRNLNNKVLLNSSFISVLIMKAASVRVAPIIHFNNNQQPHVGRSSGPENKTLERWQTMLEREELNEAASHDNKPSAQPRKM